MKKAKRIIKKILVLFVIVNLISSSFYPVLVYAQDEDEQTASYLTDDFGTAAPEDPLLSQTPGLAQANDINKDFEELQPVVIDEETQDKTLEAYDELAQKMADVTNLGNVALRVEEEKEAPQRSYTLANEILERGGSVREVNLGDQAARLWNGFTGALAGIGAVIKNTVAPDEETKKARELEERVKADLEEEVGGARKQAQQKRLNQFIIALISVSPEEKAKIVQGMGLGTEASDAELQARFLGDKGLKIDGDPALGNFVIVRISGYPMGTVYESPGYGGWRREETVKELEKTGEVVADLGTLGVYSAVKRFPELKGEFLPKVVEACSGAVDTNSNGFRYLVGEYQGGSVVCADPTTCVPQPNEAEKEEVRSAASAVKASKACYESFVDYTELMADAYAGLTSAVLQAVVDPIVVAGVVVKVTSRGANAAMRLAGKSVRVSEGTRVIRPSEVIPAPIPEGRVPVAGVKPSEIIEAPFMPVEEGVGAVRRFEPTEVADSIAPSAGERAAEAVRAAGQVPGMTTAELARVEIEEEVQRALQAIADVEVNRVAREAGERVAERAVAGEAAEEVAAETAAEAVGETIARVGGRELVPNNPVSRAVAWVQDRVDGILGRRAEQEAAGLTRGEAARAIEAAADDAARLAREGRPVEEAVAEAVDGNLSRALDEVVDGEAREAGEKASRAVAEQEATGKIYSKETRRSGKSETGTLEITSDDELVTVWQFEALEEIYRAAPENVARPIKIKVEGGKVTGYEMEFVEGVSAREFIEKNGLLPEELRQKIRAAVDSLHQKGVAHGDLNPGNVMITPDGQIKFIDPFPYPDFRPEYIQTDIDRLTRWLNSDRAALPREEIPQAILAARVAGEETERTVAEVGGRLVGVTTAGVITPNPFTRVMQSVTDSARGVYDSTVGRVFGRKDKEIGKEAVEQVARRAREAVEEAVPEVPQSAVTSRVSPEARARLIEGLGDVTTREPGEIISDWVKNDLDHITPTNLASLLQEAKNRIRGQRRAYVQEIENLLDPSEALRSVCMGSSASHALACAVNGEETFRALRNRVEKLAKERRIGRNNPDLAYTIGFLDRHIEMNNLEAQLFEIDTARRISIVKGDPVYFENALKNYPELTREVSQALDEFERANTQLIRSLPRSEQEKLTRQISELRQLLSQQDPNVLREIFYDKIINDYTDIVFTNFEILNMDRLKTTFRSLQEAQGGGIFGFFRRPKPSETFRDIPQTITTNVEDFVGGTLGQFARKEQAVPAREPIAQRTIANLTRGGVNEDSVLANKGTVSVFDGAGGHASGEVASGIARNNFDSVLRELPERPSTEEVVIALRTAHERAIESMRRFAEENPASRKMGTTATVVRLFEDEGERRAAILSVGDTRAYVVNKDGSIKQLTQDDGALAHDVADGKITPQRAQEIQRRLGEVTDISQLSREEAYYYEKRNQTNLLTPGIISTPRIEVFRVGKNADYFLVLSDGVHDNLTASQIEVVVRSARSPQEAIDNLVVAARENASRRLNHRAKDDDITAVAMDVSSPTGGRPHEVLVTPAEALKNPDRPVYVGRAQEQAQFGIEDLKIESKPSSAISREVYNQASETANKLITEPTDNEITAIATAIERGLSESEINNAHNRARKAIERLKETAKVISYEIHEAEVVRYPGGAVEEVLRPTGKKAERLDLDFYRLLQDPEFRRLMDDLRFETGTDSKAVEQILDFIAKKSKKQREASGTINLEEVRRDIELLTAPFFQASLARESTLKEAPKLIEQTKRGFEVLRDFCLNNYVPTTLLSNCMRYFPEDIFDVSNVHILSPEAYFELCSRESVGCYKEGLKKIFILRGSEKRTFIHECTHKYCDLVAINTDLELEDLLRSQRRDIKPGIPQTPAERFYKRMAYNPIKLIEGLTEYATQKAIYLMGEKAPYVVYSEAVGLIEKRVIPTIMKNSNRTREQAEAVAIEAAFGNYEKLFLEVGGGNRQKGAEILTSILDEWVPRTPEELQRLQKIQTALKIAAAGGAVIAGGAAGQAANSLINDYLNKPTSSGQEDNSSPHLPNLLPFSDIQEVLAAGGVTERTGYFIDSNALELTAKKEVVKSSLSEGRGIISDDLRQILSVDTLAAQALRIKGGYIFITGKSGVAEGFTDLGKYTVEVGAIPGIDIRVPGTIDVKAGQEVVVPVAVKEGLGRVEKLSLVHENDGLIRKAYAQKETGSEPGKVTVVVFSDKNKNGGFDKNEDILPWAGLTVELKRVSNESAISLRQGDNQVSLPVLPDKLLTASILLREIALQGGGAVSVSTFEDGAWKTYVIEGAKAYSFEDFPILPGKTYSVKANKDSTFILKGQEFVTPR